jgi:t-SNARE complex subunit (syntaxin)
MSFLWKYPHTSFEEINLDYILKRIEQIEIQIKTIKEEIEGEIFEWVQEQIAPIEEELNKLIADVTSLEKNVTDTLEAYDKRIDDIQTALNAQIAQIRKDLVDSINAVNALTDTKIEQNNIWLLNQISENVGELFQVLNPFTGTMMSIQEMVDYLSAFHIVDGIDYDTMNLRALTYNVWNGLAMTYTDLTLHGNTIYV